MQYVNSQEEFNRYLWKFMKFTESANWIEYYWSTRKFLFLSRMGIYYLLFRLHYGFGYDFQFTVPGVEVKFACEEAEKLGAKINFLGDEFDPVTANRLYHETRMNFTQYFLKRFQYRNTFYRDENIVNSKKITHAGPATFSE